MIQTSTLRALAEHQQYTQLLADAQSLTAEQAQQCLPLRALAHLHNQQHDAAQPLVKQALACQSDYGPDVLTDLAAVLILQGQFDPAVVQLRRALAQQPDYAPALARLGYCHWHQGDTTMAQRLLEQSVAIAPYRLATVTHLLALNLHVQDWPAAQHWLSSTHDLLAELQAELAADTLTQQRIRLDNQQLQLWVQTGQFEVAEHWLHTLNSTDPASEHLIRAVCQYGHQLAAVDRHDQATDIIADYLKTAPAQPDLCMLQAELAELRGYYQQAIQLLQQALQQHPDNIALWNQLSATALQSANDALARQTAARGLMLAEALPADDPARPVSLAQAQTALARVESQAQQFEAAEQRYNTVLADMPDYLPALNGLGQQKMQQGQIAAAIRLFQQVRQIDPVRGQVALINARQFPDDVDTLDALEQAAKTPSLEGSLRSSLLFQLAASWEKRKDYDRAFAFARQANQSSQALLRYDANAHRQKCARIRMGFNRALFQHRPDFGLGSTLPVFIVGMPRSGTTLIEQVLAGHSEIFGAGELGIIPQCIRGMERWERHIGSGRGYPDCMDDLSREESQRIAQRILDELQAFAPTARHVIDKLPHNFENIGLIKFLFPHARIISVRRDPRDIALSNYFTDFQAKHGGMGFAYDLTTIGTHLADHNLLMHHWHQTFPGQILELSYEAVVDDLEGSARKMLSYIGVEWQPQVLNFNELDRPVATASVWQVRQPVYKTAKAKWKRYQPHLAALIAGTNAPIQPEPVTDMLTLPEPGWFTAGVALYNAGDLDAAEMNFKKMLHHNPAHAACTYMVGMVYLRKHHWQEGIARLEQAVDAAPWQQDWRNNLARAYHLNGTPAKARALNPAMDAGQPDAFAPVQLPDGNQLFNRNL